MSKKVKINFNDDESVNSIIKKVSSGSSKAPSQNYMEIGIAILILLAIQGIVFSFYFLINYTVIYLFTLTGVIVIYKVIKLIIKKSKKSKNEPKFRRK